MGTCLSEMMEAVRDLSAEEFLELADVIYRMGYVDCANGVTHSTQEQRNAKLKCRIEEWLEI